MATDLTGSVYSIIVLSYATLATTSYLFNSVEDRARIRLKDIAELKAGSCATIWDDQDAPEQATAELQKIRTEFDIVASESGSNIRRWDWLQIYLFITVLMAAVLQLFVLLHKLDRIQDGSIMKWIICIVLVGAQVATTAALPLVGLNVLMMRRKLKRIEDFASHLRLYSVLLSRKVTPIAA